MALNSGQLASDIQAVFESYPATAAIAGDGVAEAYRSYASGARSCGSPGTPNPGSLAAAKALLATALTSAFSAGNSITCAATIASALTAFWMSPPIPFVGVTPGVVILAPGGPALQAALPGMWASNVSSGASASDAASAHANLFDIFTKSVVVAHAPPSVCSLPIT